MYSNNQWESRKGRSTKTLLVAMTVAKTWRTALYNNKDMGAMFTDFRKVFDMVPHNLLTCKLQTVGITGESY